MNIQCDDKEAQELIIKILGLQTEISKLCNIKVDYAIALSNIQSKCIHSIVNGNITNGIPWHCSKCGANDMSVFKVGL